MLHKAKKMNPDAIVVATGCYAQADTEKLKEDTAVDLILGNNQKTQIVEALEEYCLLYTSSKDADLNVSSATIRNEMSDLTDMGYIVQPHTSAGRIPSDKGYRLYVDELMREKRCV